MHRRVLAVVVSAVQSCARIERRPVLSDGDARRLVRVDPNVHVGAEALPGLLDRLVDHLRGRRARGILEAHRGVGNLVVEQILQHADVELGGVPALHTRREPHQGDHDLVVEARFDDALAAVGEVAPVIERVEVADGGAAAAAGGESA